MVTSRQSKEFICEIQLGKLPSQLRVRIPLTIPISSSAIEIAHRIEEIHNLPIYHHKELSEKLHEFIQEKTYEYYCSVDDKAIQALKNRSLDIQTIASNWGKKYSLVSTIEAEERDEKEWLASKYHTLVHSPAVTRLLTLEHSYAGAVASLVAQKEKALMELSKRQGTEMKNTIDGIGKHQTDKDVNNLASHHLEESQLTEVQWDSTISALKEEQKREFKKFISESVSGSAVQTPTTPKENPMNNAELVIIEAEISLEESFTIYLGAQMKQMHNLRLISADVLQLCKHFSHNESDIPPQRMQTSMSLYTHNLNGLVLLVDDRINTYTGIKRDFARVCARSTELHFADIEDQLEAIRDIVPHAVQWRREHPPQQYHNDDEIPTSPQVPQHLKAGDIYITHHSSLPDVHVVFHMIVDDTLRSGDINSRHPVILGLRNILKIACLDDITTLTVPLLLANSMSEEMTMSWCQKRAELVYKCVKGFMMEMASWGGAEMKNMQFLVPKGISEDLFQTLSSMLPQIFRVSNPLVIKS